APRASALRLAHKLLLTPEAESEPNAEKPDGWDDKRVARHVEGALANAYRAARRARWLTLLHDSDVVYREPKSERVRLLRVREGKLLEASDAPADLPVRERTSAAARPGFDRQKYDRLRVLTSELKRVCRDGGLVSVPWCARGRLSAQRVVRALRVV